MKRAKIIFNKEKIRQYIKPNMKKLIIFAVVLIALIAVIARIAGGKHSPAAVSARETDTVTRGDITVSITGSASVEPYERYEIIPKVSGDIVYCPYEVGDAVQEGDLLYGFDTSGTDLNVERQRISLQQSQNSYNDALSDGEKLSLTAKNSGVISDLSIKAGQEITAGTKIATVADTDNLEVVLPFTQAQIDSIHVGDSAEITSSKHMSSVYGTVTHKSSASYAGSDGSTLYNVTISFTNPGAFYSGMTVGGSIGSAISPGSGTVENSSQNTVTSETNGTISKVYYQNGDYVKKGTVIATLTSDTITDKIADSTLSYRSAQLSMQQTEKDLEDYNITSPISGTVITKNSKAGDTIDKTNAATTMMVVADISKLKFNLSIDELDVSKVTEGQTVTVTCDALPGETFTGYITNVSVEGTAQNGVTTYSAEVIIEEPGTLRPSMNIDASIIVESAENVLMVPTEDVKTVGDKKYVYVKDSDPVKSDKKEEPQSGDADKMPPANVGKDNPKTGTDTTGGKPDTAPQAPDGYKAVEIQTGISSDDYMEVVSGLAEGQEIYRYSSNSADSSISMSDAMGMHGGMGGMNGGAPGGMGGAPGGMGGGPR
ncbi:MAG: efflux RND transporter periplasmic adaptor subunit [Clostridiales bacterium]|nr:efflux RND transporter periplasmic adaptor subunit [Clostridiales bacterium]